MAKVKLFWDPEGTELDSLGRKTLLRTTDGDTPFVSMSIRMLSIDAPEVHYPGNTDPAAHDARLADLAVWLQAGRAPVADGLAAHLQPKLATGVAGTLQRTQGEQAKAAFEALVEQRLTQPNGRKRPVFLRTADEPFDEYGRLLAYVAPSYTSTELAAMTLKQRATFNLLMVEAGWAAPFPIYPSLPKHADLSLLREVAEEAIQNGRGVWAEPMTLAGYEFRMCYRLWEVTQKLVNGQAVDSRTRGGWVQRYCVDITTRAIYPPQEYYKVQVANRLFIWPKDVNEAVGRLNLEPGD